MSLAELEQRLALDLEILNRPAPNWTAEVPGPDGKPMRDVIIIGAGQYGLAAAAALIFKGVRNIEVLDRAPQGHESIWNSTARMPHLRTPKTSQGLALGMAALDIRSWFTAQHGAAAWQALHKYATADFHAYLAWFRRVLALPVRNEVDVRAVLPRDGALELQTSNGAIFARRVVLATGGYGAPETAIIPDGISRELWPDRAAHSGEAIDFQRLAGRRVAVIGAAASAWDNAWVALVAGAAQVDLYVRRPLLGQVNLWRPFGQMEALKEGWYGLELRDRWELSIQLLRDNASPAPHESIRRAIAFPNFQAHLASPILSAEPLGDGVALRIGANPQRSTEVDFLILGTGFDVDPRRRPELADLLPHCVTWADRYTPEPDQAWPALSRSPFLDEGFGLIERKPGACPALGRVHLFNQTAFASMGPITTNIAATSAAAERLSNRIVTAFAHEDVAHLRSTLDQFTDPELIGTPFHVPNASRLRSEF